jgi:hypothetical protein
MTERLKGALEVSAAQQHRNLHKHLFFALCRDLTNMCSMENSAQAADLLELLGENAEYEAKGGICDDWNGSGNC